MIRSETVLRWTMPIVALAFAFNASNAADMPESAKRVYVYGKEPRHGRVAPVEKDSDLLFTPSEAMPRVAFPPHTPVLLGSAMLPGYYGSSHEYDYQGPYYGGENINYRFRLPYACGVLGYC
jgi:hypothetical protein